MLVRTWGRPKPVAPPSEEEFAAEPAEEEKPKAVEFGPEFQRILALPRRKHPDLDGPEAAALAEQLTDRFRIVDRAQLFPGPLTPVQAVALKEAWVAQGAFFQIGVGHGKSLICGLLATLFNKPRTLYVCQADGVVDAELKFAEYRKSYRVPPRHGLRVISYEKIAHPSSAEETAPDGTVTTPSLLSRLQPQVLILDESHNLANSGSATAKRIAQYLKENPDTIVIAMTGTPYKTSIKDAAHIMGWCLKEGAPLPQDFREREAWAGYLDAKQSAFGRTEIGELVRFGARASDPIDVWSHDATGTVAHTRRLVAAFILETPGVIGTQSPAVDIPLTLEPFYPTQIDRELDRKLEELRLTKTLPDGTELADPISLARHQYTLAMGFWQRWSPAPPQEWRDSRNAWSKWCRKALKHNKKRIYSEATMKSACRRGAAPAHGLELLEAWELERNNERTATGLLEPPTECVWESDETVTSVKRWLSENIGLVWVGHVGLGERLAAETGLPYYGAGGGLDLRTKRNIRDHVSGSAIVSIDACGTGKQLTFWSNNLWLTTPGEQALARTHRPGQKASIVRNWVYLPSARHLDAFDRAKDVKAAFQADFTLADLKLRGAIDTLPNIHELSVRGGNRWCSSKLDDDDDSY